MLEPPARPQRRWPVALAISAGVLLVAGLGGALTDLGPWYRNLRQPPWKPPDAWFGPIWTLIYVCTAWAAWRAWHAAGASGARTRRSTLLAAFVANAGLNIAWSALFFGAKRPDWALAEVMVLWLSIVVLIVLAARLDTLAAWLLVPYAAWVAIAAALNGAVVRANAPF
jgi:translocator protein